jgi:hypothetical protein
MKNLFASLIALLIVQQGLSKRPLVIKITTEEPTTELEQSYKDSDHDNKYKI